MAARAAEERLGRNLTDGELHLDIIGYGRDLDSAKAKLAEEIQAELRRAARAHATGRGDDRVQLTPAMEEVLQDLYELGVGHARREQESMGLRQFADDDEPESPRTIRGVLDWVRKREIAGLPIPEKILRLVPILVQLGSHLQRLDLRMRKEAVSADLGKMAQARMAEVLEKKVPGALDAAGRVVSSAMTGGVAATWDKVPGIPEWIYSAVMDANTCEPCKQQDGRRFPTLDAAYVVLPNFGPNPLCFGDGRCRCRLVPGLPDEGTPADVPPRPPSDIPPSDLLNVRMSRLERDGKLGPMLDGAVKDTFEAIDREVGPLPWDEPAPDLELRWGSQTNLAGWFTGRPHGYLRPTIAVNRQLLPPDPDRLPWVLAHEFGHFLDVEYFGRAKLVNLKALGKEQYGSSILSTQFSMEDTVRNFHEIRGVMKALFGSARFARLMAIADGDDTGLNVPGDFRKNGRYHLQPRELFAQGFAQWLTGKMPEDSAIGRDHIRALTSDLISGFPTRWEPDDFQDIADAFDKLFAATRGGTI